MNRGSCRKRRQASGRRTASMRPRFMNRGSPAWRCLARPWPDASMRPRFMNRGSTRIRPTRTWRLTSFNEAPIHESGKSEGRGGHLRHHCRASMRPRFMNRGSHRHGIQTPRHGEASMRPRFMNRGSKERGCCSASTLRSFNEAPIHESGKSRAPWHGILPASRCFNEAPIHESGKWW